MFTLKKRKVDKDLQAILSPLHNSTAFNFYEDAKDNREESDLDSAALIDSQGTGWILHDKAAQDQDFAPSYQRRTPPPLLSLANLS